LVALFALAGCAPSGPLAEGAGASGTASGPAAGFSIERLRSGADASLRGLHVVDDRVAWASGSEGHAGVTTDGGRHWTFRRAAGYEDRDFRDVEGFSAEHALVMAVGSPGVILETTDGGRTWIERFRDERPEVFLDAMECIDRRSLVEPTARPEPPDASSTSVASGSAPGTTCLAFGDPIAGRFLVVRSVDGGRSWTAIEGPESLPGEAAFAASGTALRFRRRNRSETTADGGAAVEVAIGTGGGQRSRVLTSTDLGDSWRAEVVPLAAGAASRGVFSLVDDGVAGWVAVGGDHLAPNQATGTAARQLRGRSLPPGEPARPGAPDWSRPGQAPAGYRSAVERLGTGQLITTGPNGIDRSDDLGASWLPLSTEGFHTVRCSPGGDLVLLAGADGRIARLVGTGR
jgi:photosystem II stability/assembly factor-like uncharacterized protein